MELGLLYLFDFYTILLVFLGVLIGIIFGAIPGLSATMAIALFIPMTFGMAPVAGISLLLGIYVGGMYGGCIPAILIGTPGTPANAATLLDGYAMGRNGESGRALTYATAGSFIGGLFSCLVLIFLAPQLATFGLNFGAPEYFALAVFGLSIVGSISGNNVLKGLIVASLGLLIATIGMDPMMGIPRFSFGSSHLIGGISFIPALIGLFAISQILIDAENKQDLIFSETVDYKRQRVSIKEMVSKWVEFLRAAVIGTIVGIVPGTGSGIATFLSYNESKRFSKKPEQYGKGIPEGVIATETSNNAITGGALVPLLTLGIPGDSVTAIIFGGLLIQGLTPGPSLFQENLDIVHGLFGTLILANIFMLFLGLFFIKYLVKIASIPKNVLLPMVVVFCLIGSYSISNSVFDIWVALIFGVIGYFLSKFNYPLPPLILGMILGPIIESNFRRSMIQSDSGILIFFTKPISLFFIIITLLTLLYPVIRKCFQKNANNALEI